MRIINETAWPTEPLRKIIKRVAREELDPEHRKRAVVHIQYRGRNRCLGRGQLGRSPKHAATTIWLYVDRPERLRCVGKGWCGKDGCGMPYSIHARFVDHPFVPIPSGLNGPQLAYVAAHEFQHNLGRQHRQMHRKYIVHDYTPWSWASDIEFVPAPKPSAQQELEKKLAHAQTMLRKAETRSKRASTIVKKWQRRVKQVSRRTAALQQAPGIAGMRPDELSETK